MARSAHLNVYVPVPAEVFVLAVCALQRHYVLPAAFSLHLLPSEPPNDLSPPPIIESVGGSQALNQHSSIASFSFHCRSRSFHGVSIHANFSWGCYT